MWLCPNCSEPLSAAQADEALVCPAGHRFDRAREGYVNLLATGRRGSREPGDSAGMLTARRRIHQAGLFEPLAEALASVLDPGPQELEVLDLGCGEGYYSGFIKQQLPASTVRAVDISKRAVRMAAKKYDGVDFAVASAFQLPLASSGQDAVMRVFAPSEDAEVSRVLREGGYYLEVVPRNGHLLELRRALYEQVRDLSAVRDTVPGMALLKCELVDYRVELGAAQLADLVAMTPFAWRGHREKREALLRRDGLALQMAFALSLFRRESGAQEVGGGDPHIPDGGAVAGDAE